jgi:diguanylate cyclase (GGDEF)-like protein
MMRLITRLGRFRTIVLITLFSIIASALITKGIFLWFNQSLPWFGIIVSMIAPLIIAPSVTWTIVGLLIKIQALEIEMRQLATYDSLTSLFNRYTFINSLELLLNRRKLAQSELAILYIDIDHFKKINDSFGHDIGDKVIISFANVLRNSVRKTDIIGRFGGEEFVIALPNTNLKESSIVSEKIRQNTINDLICIDSQIIQYTVSIGVAIADNINNGEIKELLKIADTALYQAKRTGRNKICLANAI